MYHRRSVELQDFRAKWRFETLLFLFLKINVKRSFSIHRTFIFVLGLPSSLRSKVTSTKEGILLSFQKWFKRREGKSKKDEESVTVQGRKINF